MSAARQQNPQLQLKLSVVKGPHAGQVFHVNQDKLTIGRGPENDIVLINDPLISRSHAQIYLNDREFEIVKLSQKNGILINGESVDRWKLLNQSVFQLGDSELKIEYDLGQAVVSVAPSSLKPVGPPKVKLVPQASPVKSTAVVTASMPKPMTSSGSVTPASIPQKSPTFQQPAAVTSAPAPGFQSAAYAQRTVKPIQDESILDHPKFKFYAIVGILLVGFLIFILSPNKSKSVGKPKPTLKYEDEVEMKLNSKPEKELAEKRAEKKLDRNSPQYLRAEENFIKGMRDFQLGNYARAQDFFQVVLNLQPDHVLARRHLYLSKVRFDELIQEKLMLGESYYNKHNFSMCSSMYQQVMDMLGDRQSDTKWKLAKSKKDECDLAQEGIR